MSIKIVNATGNVFDTKVIDTRTGEKITELGITRIAIDIDDGQVRGVANLVIHELDVTTDKVTFHCHHPITRKLQEIRHIDFADGTRLHFVPDAAPIVTRWDGKKDVPDA